MFCLFWLFTCWLKDDYDVTWMILIGTYAHNCIKKDIEQQNFNQNTKLSLSPLNCTITLKRTDMVTLHDLDLTSRFRSALSRCRLLLSLAFCKALYSGHWSSSRAFFRWAAAWAMTLPLADLKRLLCCGLKLHKRLEKAPHVQPQLDVKKVKIHIQKKPK